MNTYEHIYFELNGVKYYDYTLYTEVTPWRHYGKTPEYEFGLNGEVKDKIETLEGLVDKTITPAQGCDIHVTPGCPIACEDLRKHYTLKRGLDNGDYNVFTPLKCGCGYVTYIYPTAFLFYPSQKIVFAGEAQYQKPIATRAVLEQLADSTVSGLNHSEAVYDASSMSIYLYSKKYEYFLKLLEGKLTKPCISYTQLDVNSQNEVTLDLLRLVYEAGNRHWYEQDAEKNYVIQLNVLNQHNWRDYIGTISMLIGDLITGVGVSVKNRASQQPKAIQQILSHRYEKDFISEKDLKMGQAFVDSLLGIGDCRFTNYVGLDRKLMSVSLSHASFDRLYNNIIRITPKQYAEAGQS